jgi:hypothetical protein
MWVGHVFEVCERISEAQAVLRSEMEGSIAPEAALNKLRELLSEPGLHEAMYNIGYFPKRPAPLSTGDNSAAPTKRN